MKVVCKMVDIDYIIDLLDWDKTLEEQNKGLELARKVKCISVFMQPVSPYGKGVWDNCAKVLAEKDDKTLEPYLFYLLEWLQDMNWPGAQIIYDRLLKMDFKDIEWEYNHSLDKANKLGDTLWIMALTSLKKDFDNK